MPKAITKVTIDTNVIISALIFGRNSKIIVDKLLKREFIAFTSIQLVSELVETLLIKFNSTREMILKLIDDRLYGDLKKPQIDISKLELSNHG